MTSLCYAVLCCAVQADETLAKFLDFCTYGHMIDNVVLIVTGTLHERDVQVNHGGVLLCAAGHLREWLQLTQQTAVWNVVRGVRLALGPGGVGGGGLSRIQHYRGAGMHSLFPGVSASSD